MLLGEDLAGGAVGMLQSAIGGALVVLFFAGKRMVGNGWRWRQSVQYYVTGHQKQNDVRLRKMVN